MPLLELAEYLSFKRRPIRPASAVEDSLEMTNSLSLPNTTRYFTGSRLSTADTRKRYLRMKSYKSVSLFNRCIALSTMRS